MIVRQTKAVAPPLVRLFWSLTTHFAVMVYGAKFKEGRPKVTTFTNDSFIFLFTLPEMGPVILA